MLETTSTVAVPSQDQLETPAVLRELIQAHRALAELKGIAKTIPNEAMLISPLSLQEAQSSSEIENIITTQDTLLKYRLQAQPQDTATKEVSHYADALRLGYLTVKETGLLTLNTILQIQVTLEGNQAGYRKLPGTILQNEASGKVVFQAPTPEKIPPLMSSLEIFMHKQSTLDPLVRMALIHHHFETIHPFYDGNGRTGRIINILFLVKEGLLDMPILYLSRYINQNKSGYYKLLQQTRTHEQWEPWLLYLIKGVSQTAQHTTQLVQNINALLLKQKNSIRSQFKFYSQDLMNNLFSHPYTKVAFLEKDMNISRATAARYLDALAKGGILVKQKLGRENYYINHELVEFLFSLPKLP